MEIFFGLLILFGIIIMMISIKREQTQSQSRLSSSQSNSSSTSVPPQSQSRLSSSQSNSSSTSVPPQSQSRLSSSQSNSSSASVPQALSLEFSSDLPELSSELKSKRDGYLKLYKDALALYKIEQIETASEKFREASNLMKIIRTYYPNNLQINFELLETYQGCDYNQAIQQGFRCLEILDTLMQDSFSPKKVAGLILTRCDILRKSYKLLIKENRVSEAQSILRDLVKKINLIIDQNPPPYRNESTHITMFDLAKEQMIASFFLQGIIEGRNMQRNLVASSVLANDSPELGYHFDPSFSSADAEIFSILFTDARK